MEYIFRNDDVSSSTNFTEMNEMYELLQSKFPTSEIWSCVNVFSKGDKGSVYPELPLRGHDMKWFYDVDRSWRYVPILGKIVSHGLFHVEHDKLSRDAQEMSILGSCGFLKVNIFVPPFTAYNEETKSICASNGIRLCSDMDGWKSLESEPFDPKHKLWFFHSWRFNPESFKELFK